MTAMSSEKCHGQEQVAEMIQVTNPAHIIESTGNNVQKAEVPGRRGPKGSWILAEKRAK